jgi:hypothetical protein
MKKLSYSEKVAKAKEIAMNKYNSSNVIIERPYLDTIRVMVVKLSGVNYFFMNENGEEV